MTKAQGLARGMLFAIVEILTEKGMKFSSSVNSDKVVAFMGYLPKYEDTYIAFEARDGTLGLRFYAQPGLNEPELVLVETEIFRRIQHNLGLPPPGGCYKMTNPKLPTTAEISQAVLDAINYLESVWAVLLRDPKKIRQEMRKLIKKHVDAAEKKI